MVRLIPLAPHKKGNRPWSQRPLDHKALLEVSTAQAVLVVVVVGVAVEAAGLDALQLPWHQPVGVSLAVQPWVLLNMHSGMRLPRTTHPMALQLIILGQGGPVAVSWQPALALSQGWDQSLSQAGVGLAERYCRGLFK